MASTRKGLVFGKIAVKKGFISKGDLKECIKRQKELAEENETAPSIKKILKEAGYVTDEQVEEIEDIREKIGQKKEIPGYEIHEKLGEGATGAVYKATQLSLDRPVAIKVLYPSVIEDETYLDRFYREARTVAKLNHEGIIQGIDVGEENGLYYFVMEYVEGESLDEILKREGKISENQAIEIGLQAARAMKHADEHGLIHRDIKPENIMIDQEGVAKLCDLGLAKKMGNEDSSVTQMGVTIGTPHYMSPEQAKGEELDIRTDIYALGASLYHAVTGDVPFDADAAASVMTKHVTEELEEPKENNPNLSARFNSVITKMMEKDPAERYQDPDELIEDFERVQEGKDPKHATVNRERSRGKGPGRSSNEQGSSSGSDTLGNLGNWKVASAGGAILVGLLIFISYSSFSSTKTDRARVEQVKDDVKERDEGTGSTEETAKNQNQKTNDQNNSTQQNGTSKEGPDEKDDSQEESKSLTELRRESFENLKKEAKNIEQFDRVEKLHLELSSLMEKVEDSTLKGEIRTFLNEYLEKQSKRYYEEKITVQVTPDTSINAVLQAYKKLDGFPEVFDQTDIWQQKVKTERQKAKDRISVYMGEMKRQLEEKVKNESFQEAEEIVQKMENLTSTNKLPGYSNWKEARIHYLSERSRYERNKLNESEQHLKEFKQNFQQHYRLANKSILQISDKRANEMIDWYTENTSIEAVRNVIDRYREDVKMLGLYRKQLKQKLNERKQSSKPIEIGERTGKLVGTNGHMLLIQMRNSRMKKPASELGVGQRIALANWKNNQLDDEEKYTFGLVAYLANDLTLAEKWLKKADSSGVNRAGYYLTEVQRRKMAPREQKALDLIDMLRRAKSAGLNFAMGRIMYDLQFYKDTDTYSRNKSLVTDMREQLDYDPGTFIKGVNRKKIRKRVKRQIVMFRDWYNADVGRGAGKGTIYLTYNFKKKKQLKDWSLSNSDRLSVDLDGTSSKVRIHGQGYWLHDLQFAGRASLEARISMKENLDGFGALVMWSDNRGYRGMYNWSPLGFSSELSKASANVLQFMRLPSNSNSADYTSTRLETISRVQQNSLTGKNLGRLGIHRENKKLRLTLDGQTRVSAEDDRINRGRTGLFFERGYEGNVLGVTISGKPDQEWFEQQLEKRGIAKNQILQEGSGSGTKDTGGANGNLQKKDVPKTNVAFAVNLGGPSVEAGGYSFRSDPFKGNNNKSYSGKKSSGDPDPSAKYSELYKTQRWGSEMWYSLPVARGSYEVTLFFFENNWTQSGKRKFDVFLEKQRVLESFDIFKESGGKDQGVTKTFDQIWVGDGALDIKLEGLSDSDDKNATIAGFLIRRTGVPKKSSDQEQNESEQNQSGEGSNDTNDESSEQNNVKQSSSNESSERADQENKTSQINTPLEFQGVSKGEVAFAINIGNGPLSRNGVRFQADPYKKNDKGSISGQKSTKFKGSRPDTLAKIYHSNRYGKDMSFKFPLSNGEYKVKLYLVENWQDESGSRVFDVELQGNRVLQDFDLFSEAGGRHKKMVKTFKNITVQNQQLVLNMKASTNHAILSGILIRKTGS